MDKSRRLFLANTTFGALGAGLFENTLCRLSNEGAIRIHDNKPESAVNNYYKSIKFISDKKSSGIVSSSVVVEKAKSVFCRIVKERTGIDLMSDNGDELKIQFAIYPNSLPEGGFRINYEHNSLVTISSGDEMGIYYGIGKFLHTSVLNENGIKPGTWSGSSVPKKSLRAIYFATHFHNYYHVAPISEISDYIEELALWGYNHLVMWFDMHHFENINTHQSQKMLDRLAQLYKIGESVGMFPYGAMLANEGYSDSPLELRAEKTGRSHYGVEICPSIDAGKKLILTQARELLKAYEDRGVIFKVFYFGPYDQGGCGCKLCAPWGSNGFVNISKSISYELRKRYPELKISLGTWLFDYGSDQGEWKGLEERFQDIKPEWVDYLLADSHTSYPQFLLDNPVPGNLPLINFPEISMWGQWP